jgi:hypothetical protein
VSPQLEKADNSFADTKIGHNDACPCGSGKKCKKCCGPDHDACAGPPTCEGTTARSELRINGRGMHESLLIACDFSVSVDFVIFRFWLRSGGLVQPR